MLVDKMGGNETLCHGLIKETFLTVYSNLTIALQLFLQHTFQYEARISLMQMRNTLFIY
jgi:hypothetical protein